MNTPHRVICRPIHMFTLRPRARRRSTLIAHLHVFSVQVRDDPAHEETLATWKLIEDRLPAEHQSRILKSWNRHLAGTNDPNEISDVVENVVRQLAR